MNDSTDSIVIAGGGPGGLMLACELGLAGLRAIVLERDTVPAGERFSPGNTLHARSVELLQRRGLMDEIDAHEPMIWPRVHFSNIWIDLTPMIEEEYSLVVPQPLTEQVLEARAVQLGAEIRRGHEVVGLTQDASGVTVQVGSAADRYELRCRYLIGCDGGDSTVRRLARIDAPETGIEWCALLADVEAHDYKFELQSPSYPGGVFTAIPHPGGVDLLRIWATEYEPEPSDKDRPPTGDEVRDAVRRITGEDYELPGKPGRIYRYRNRTRLAQRYRSGNVFLLGDAAHLHYFAAGHGLNTTLHDAANLGWKLAAAVRGWAPDGLLDTYHDERHPVGRRACAVIKATMALEHPPEQMAPLREVFEELLTLRDVQRRLVSLITDVTYPMRLDGVNNDGHPLLGRPVSDAQVSTADGDSSVATALRTGHGVVLDFSGGAQDVAQVAAWSGRVDLIAADPVKEIDATALLVRPDGHVAWADTTAKDTGGLTAALTTWFGSP